MSAGNWEDSNFRFEPILQNDAVLHSFWQTERSTTALTSLWPLRLERVRATGVLDPERVVIWISKPNPGADHDIRSVGADGRPVYIEVKSTTGDDGRFDWSAAEFSLALKYGEDYELWRVYGVGGTAPTIKKFRTRPR